MSLPRWLSGEESVCQCRTLRFDPWVRKISWRRKWQPTAVFLCGKSHGQRSLEGYIPWSHKSWTQLDRSMYFPYTDKPWLLTSLKLEMGEHVLSTIWENIRRHRKILFCMHTSLLVMESLSCFFSLFFYIGEKLERVRRGWGEEEEEKSHNRIMKKQKRRRDWEQKSRRKEKNKIKLKYKLPDITDGK